MTDSGAPADPGRAGGGGALPPLVLVPGIGGPRGTFHYQVAAFRGERRVVALELNPARGRGMGAVASAALDVRAALDALAIERADVLGASFGTTVVTRFALDHPERVRRIAWVAPPVVRHGPWRATFGPGWLLGGALLAYSPVRWHPAIARFLARHRMYSPEPELTPHELELMAERVTDTQFAPFFDRLFELAGWDWAAPGPAASAELDVAPSTNISIPGKVKVNPTERD